MGAGIEAYPVS